MDVDAAQSLLGLCEQQLAEEAQPPFERAESIQGTTVEALKQKFDFYHQAAERDHPSAQCKLAQCFDSGVGTTTDKKQAFYWHQRAAGNGDGNAAFFLGIIFTTDNKEYEVNADLDTARNYLYQALANGIPGTDAPLQHCLQELKKTKPQLKVDPLLLEIKTLQTRIEDKKECKDEDEEARKADLERVIERVMDLYYLLAEADHAPSQYKLAELHYQGRFVDVSIMQSVHLAQFWLKRAGENADLNALQVLTNCFGPGGGDYGFAADTVQAASYRQRLEAEHVRQRLAEERLQQQQLDEQYRQTRRKKILRACAGISVTAIEVFAVLTTLGLGIYLATVFIAPLLLSLLLAAGIVPWAAFILMIAGSCGVVFGTAWVLIPGSSVAKALIRPWKLLKATFHLRGLLYVLHEPMGIYSIVASLAGLGFGIYLATLITPAIIKALMVLGISHGFTIFMGIAASFIIIHISIEMLVQPAALYLVLKDFLEWSKCLRPTFGMKSLYVLGGLGGAGLGIYLSIMIAPLLTAALSSIPGVNAGIALFLVIAISIALISCCARIAYTVGTLVGTALDRCGVSLDHGSWHQDRIRAKMLLILVPEYLSVELHRFGYEDFHARAVYEHEQNLVDVHPLSHPVI